MITTVDELRAAYPELTAQLENAARTDAMNQGAEQERSRLEAIDAIRNGIGDADLVRNAMFGENRMTAAELALAAIKANAAQGAAVLASLGDDTQPAAAVEPAPAPVVEPTPDPNAGLEADLQAIKNVITR